MMKRKSFVWVTSAAKYILVSSLIALLMALILPDAAFGVDGEWIVFDAYDAADTYVGGIRAYFDVVYDWLDSPESKNQPGGAFENLTGGREWQRRLSKGYRLPRFVDEEGLLTPEQATTLTAKLDEISERHRFDVVIATVYSLGSWEAHLYGADFLEQNGFGYGEELDSAILLLAMEDRDFGFATFGFGIEAFTDEGQIYLNEQFLPQLAEDDYYGAFMAFADAVDDFLSKAEEGKPYNKRNRPMTETERNSLRRTTIIGSLLGALIVATITTEIWRGQLKSVYKSDYANVYIREGSMMLTGKSDIFLHRNVSKIRRQTSSSGGGSGGSSRSFSSSSGRSSSGHSGKF